MIMYKTYFFIGLSIIIAMILSVLPTPNWVSWYRPQWLILVTIYWVIALPHRFGLITAWLIGLINDALQGTLLGEHSLAMVLVSCLAIKFAYKMAHLPRVHQLLCISLFVAIYQLTLIVVEVILSDSQFHWQYSLPIITSIFLWPWIEMILKSYQRRHKLS